jgi:hypothetical protein
MSTKKKASSKKKQEAPSSQRISELDSLSQRISETINSNTQLRNISEAWSKEFGSTNLEELKKKKRADYSSSSSSW